jgi:hypothetical protein
MGLRPEAVTPDKVSRRVPLKISRKPAVRVMLEQWNALNGHIFSHLQLTSSEKRAG